jgi:ABC-type Fe3+ transport system substrate-binding protein
MAGRSLFSKRTIRGVVVLLGVVLVLAACGDTGSDEEVSTTAAQVDTTAPPTTDAATDTTSPASETSTTVSAGEDLEAACEAEGSTLVWYNSGNPDLVESVVQGFQEAYPGVTVEGVAVNFTELPAKVATEHATNAPTADVLWVPPTLRQGVQELGAITPVDLANDANMPEDSLDPDGYAHPVWQLAIGLVYDPTITTDMPTDPAQLGDPAYADRIAFDRVANLGQSTTWLSVWRGDMGDDPWLEWLDAVAANNIFITANARSAYEAVVTQEREIAIASSNYILFQDPGLTVEMWPGIPLVPFLNHQYLMTRAEHPGCAQLFMEWSATEDGQRHIADVGLSPVMDIEHENSMSAFIDSLEGAELLPGTDLVDFATRTDEYLEELTARWPG